MGQYHRLGEELFLGDQRQDLFRIGAGVDDQAAAIGIVEKKIAVGFQLTHFKAQVGHGVRLRIS